jgi:hypothetical protein
MAERAKTEVCARCGAHNLSPEVGKAIFCTSCGERLKPLPSFLPATPAADVCPICDHKCVRIRDVFHKRNEPIIKDIVPPDKPLPLWLFGSEPAGPVDGYPTAGASWETGESLDTVAAAAGSAATWDLGISPQVGMAGAVVALGIAAVSLVLEVVGAIGEGMTIEHRESLRRWNSAYYCSTDRIVFIRHMNDVQWAPADKLRDLIQRAG